MINIIVGSMDVSHFAEVSDEYPGLSVNYFVCGRIMTWIAEEEDLSTGTGTVTTVESDYDLTLDYYMNDWCEHDSPLALDLFEDVEDDDTVFSSAKVRRKS